MDVTERAPRALDVCCVADLCADLILSGNVVPRFGQAEQLIEGYAVEPGGSGTIFASQFARLGGRVGLVATVGEDLFGGFLQEWLASVGIDLGRVRRDAAIKTGIGVSLVKPDGDRGMLTYLGTIDATEPAALADDVLTGCRHWHVASPFLLTRLRAYWPEWLARCRAAGLSTSLDTNWDPDERWEGVRELLPLIDVFLPNDAEARAISGEAEIPAAGAALARRGPLVVVKCGAEGATAFHKDGRTWRVRADVDADGPFPIVDSVGAGDNFDAGFLRAWLRGQDIEACLRLATRCARASLGAAGGIQGQLREDVT